MSIDQIPQISKGAHEYLCQGIREWQTVPADINEVYHFIEAVMLDEQSEQAGLWQGDMPVDAMKALLRIIERVRPIPVTERLPDGAREVFAFFSISGAGWEKAWFDGNPNNPSFTLDGIQYGLDQVTHWLPLPPNPKMIEIVPSPVPITSFYIESKGTFKPKPE